MQLAVGMRGFRAGSIKTIFPMIFKQCSTDRSAMKLLLVQCQMWTCSPPGHILEYERKDYNRERWSMPKACSSAHRSKVLANMSLNNDSGSHTGASLCHICTCEEKSPYNKPVTESEFHLPVCEFHDPTWSFYHLVGLFIPFIFIWLSNFKVPWYLVSF